MNEKKAEQKEVVAQGTSTPAELLKIAVSGGAEIDKLEKLIGLQERYETNEARKAYHKAMTEFKANAPEITKDRQVSYKPRDKGTVSYKHASLANVTGKISAALSDHNLSASWQTAQNGAVSVTCKITHILGHSEETTLTAPADTSGSKNDIQAIGSTISYLQRYTLLSLTGLATGDQDDDGRGSELVDLIDEKQLSSLLDFVNSGTDKGKLLNYMGLEKLEDMPKKDYQKAITAIQNSKEAKK